jgi:ornithine carbamoyltransferase
MYQLGGHALFLSGNDLQLNRGETVADTARVLSRYVDGIMARVFAHRDVQDLASYGSVPVINGLSDLLHPCQALADYMTLLEHKGHLEGLKLVYVGDGNNVAHSLVNAGVKLGAHVVVACPPGYEPDAGILTAAREAAVATGARVEVCHEPQTAVQGADAIYTDVWASMGQEKEAAERKRVFAPFQVNEALFERAKPDAIFLHCLPAHRGDEVTDGVADHPRSAIFDEAENRLHAQKAVLVELLGA